MHDQIHTLLCQDVLDHSSPAALAVAQAAAAHMHIISVLHCTGPAHVQVALQLLEPRGFGAAATAGLQPAASSLAWFAAAAAGCAVGFAEHLMLCIHALFGSSSMTVSTAISSCTIRNHGSSSQNPQPVGHCSFG